jgi:plastocyanin
MSFTWRISIKPLPKPTSSARASFVPVQTPQDIQVGDQIVWTNEDSEAHFPSPVLTSQDTAYSFMGDQIAGNSSSPGFAPGNTGIVQYFCANHPGEKGSFEVKATPDAGTEPKT